MINVKWKYCLIFDVQQVIHHGSTKWKDPTMVEKFWFFEILNEKPWSIRIQTQITETKINNTDCTPIENKLFVGNTDQLMPVELLQLQRSQETSFSLVWIVSSVFSLSAPNSSFRIVSWFLLTACAEIGSMILEPSSFGVY